MNADGMSDTRVYVFGGGRWREVTLDGRVEGWGRARFVAARGGRLELCARDRVLRGLRALAAGRPTCVRDGPPLEQFRPESPAPAPRGSRNRRQHGPSPPPRTSLGKLARLTRSTATVGTQCAAAAVHTADAAVQACAPAAGDARAGAGSPAEGNASDNAASIRSAAAAPEVKLAYRGRDVVRRGRASSSESSGEESSAEAGSVSSGTYKELTVDEAEVALVRRAAAAGAAPFPVSLARFDADGAYQRRVLYRLHPVVGVERCERLERLLREARRAGGDGGRGGAAPAEAADAPEWASPPRSEAGLAHREAPQPRASSRSRTPSETQRYVKAPREYSALEDASIVRWLREGGGERARRVNGNALWRQLQPEHQRRTGRFRSWHSLRNRYLRTLLPRPPPHLPAAELARLRAAAATGEIKRHRARRNSIFEQVPARDAWSRRRRSPSPGALAPDAGCYSWKARLRCRSPIYRQPTDRDPSPSLAAPPPPPRALRRRLYNPNQEL